MANNQHISDELLAAFLEGNVNEKEVAQVLQAAKADAEIQEVFDIAMQLDDAEMSMLQMAAEGGRNLCDVQCEAFVLKRCGIDSEVEELLEVAKANHWIRRAGVPLNCIGNLLVHKGLKVTRKLKASIEDIKESLDKGCGIIVAVDCDKLYPERPDEEDATNHAVVVIRYNTDKETITLFDPEVSVEADVKLSLFLSAWKESNYYMVSAIK